MSIRSSSDILRGWEGGSQETRKRGSEGKMQEVTDVVKCYTTALGAKTLLS